jgi:hypothetical protein
MPNPNLPPPIRYKLTFVPETFSAGNWVGYTGTAEEIFDQWEEKAAFAKETPWQFRERILRFSGAPDDTLPNDDETILVAFAKAAAERGNVVLEELS